MPRYSWRSPSRVGARLIRWFRLSRLVAIKHYRSTRYRFDRFAGWLKRKLGLKIDDHWLSVSSGKTKVSIPRLQPAFGASARRSFDRRGRVELSLLEERAVHDLFDWIGWPVIPNIFFELLKTSTGPADGLDAFAHALGLDPDKLHARDAETVARGLDLVLALAALDFSSLVNLPEAKAKIYQAFESGDANKVRNAAENISDLLQARGILEKAERAISCVIFQELTAKIESELMSSRIFNSPGPRWADRAARYFNSVKRAAIILEALEQTCTELHYHWPSAWTNGPEEAEVAQADLVNETAILDLKTRDNLSPDEFDGICDQIEEAARVFEDLLKRAHRHKGRAKSKGKAGSRAKSKRSGGASSLPLLHQDYLEFLGFAINKYPTKSALTAEFMRRSQASGINKTKSVTDDEKEEQRQLLEAFQTLRSFCI